MKTIRTFFKVESSNVRSMGFNIKAQENSFNYVSLDRNFPSDRVALVKHMSNSFELAIRSNYPLVKELKLTNQNILTWEDYWIDEDSHLVDPRIESINLQKNSLMHFNSNLSRPSIKSINVESNTSMVGFVLFDSPNLEYINLSNCPNLQNVTLGNNSKIKALLARNCNLSSQVQENLLRDFKPTISSRQCDDFLMFRKVYDTILDLRGSVIDWGNRRVASKIRLLLCNNWLVLWDNPPPTSVVPPQMYAFFTNNLEEDLIRKYYLN